MDLRRGGACPRGLLLDVRTEAEVEAAALLHISSSAIRRRLALFAGRCGLSMLMLKDSEVFDDLHCR